jgi:cardiolipin synthase
LPLAAAVWLSPASAPWLIALAVVAGATDILDGWLATRLKLAGGAGTWLDPLCDKIFILSLAAAIGFAWGPGLAVVLLIAARELILLPAAAALFLSARRGDWRAAWIGRLATGAQIAAIGAILLRTEWVWPAAVVAGVTGAAAGIFYVARTIIGVRGTRGTARAAAPAPRRSP